MMRTWEDDLLDLLNGGYEVDAASVMLKQMHPAEGITISRVQRAQTQLRKDKRLGKFAPAVPLAPPKSIQPLYNTPWTLDGKGGWLLIGDLHAPFINWIMLVQAITKAREWGIENLLIVGDLFDAAQYSPFPATVPVPGFETEKDAATCAVDLAMATFKKARVTTGNHDIRPAKKLEGGLSGESAADTFLGWIGGSRDKKVEWSIYGYADITTPTGIWRATHQKNYSRTRGQVAVKLASKLRRHVVTFHEHGLGKLPSECGQFTCIACGCMADIDRIAYLNLVDNTSPVWQNGYVILDEAGTGHLFGGPPGFC